MGVASIIDRVLSLLLVLFVIPAILQFAEGIDVEPPTAGDIFNYRYQHGTNLASIYVLEWWLTGSMYPSSSTGGSELDAVQASINASGLQATCTRWESHWSNAITEHDFTWLFNTAHSNMLRLPIGWFTLGPALCTGTTFDGDPAQVYINAWAAVKSLVQRAHDHGIGVLIDFHALPGGANKDLHSGTSTGKAELWGNETNLDLAKKCLVYIAQEAKKMPGIVGMELCNEAVQNSPGMYEWYDSVISAIGEVNSEIPIYISDGWAPWTAIDYTRTKNQGSLAGNPVVVDNHRYYWIAAEDTDRSASEIIAKIPYALGELDSRTANVFDFGAANEFVGEYSCVLADNTWEKGGDRVSLTKEFGQAQSRRWQQRASGSAFWTLKMDWMDGGDWGFKQQTDDGAITPPEWLLFKLEEVRDVCEDADSKKVVLHDEAVLAHTGLWTDQVIESERFSEGWNLGWSDAESFFRARAEAKIPPDGGGGDKIGMLDLWVRKRMKETGQSKEQTGYGWEWEHGFRKGLADFENAVGI